MSDQNKKKSLTIKALMGNTKLRQTLQEGLTSPPGSTKRKKAATLLRSLSSINQNKMDGMGGNMFGQLGATGIMGTASTTQLNIPPMYRVGSSTSGASNIQLSPQQLAGIAPTSNAGLNISGPQQPRIGQQSSLGTAPQDTSRLNITPQMTTVYPKATTPTTPAGAAQQQEQVPDPNLPSPGSPMVFAPTLSDIMSQAFYGKTAAELTPEQLAAGSTIETGITQAGGPTSFANLAMRTPKLMSALTGMPESEIPAFASLSGQLQELYDTTRKQYALDEQENNLRNMQATGVVLMSDLGAYTKGKDEYVKVIDGLLEKTKANMYTNQDISNPYTYASMNQYLDYLNILKGRQELRYTDLIQTSVDQYNAQIGFSLDKLNADKEKFLIDYQNKGAIATEEYNDMKSMLMEIYDNYSTIDEQNSEKILLEADVTKALYEIAQLGTPDTDSRYLKNRTYYDALLKPYIQTTKADTTNVPMINGDINEMMNIADQSVINVSTGEKLYSGDIFTAIKNNIISAAPPMVENGMTKELIDNYKSMILNYYNSNYNTPQGNYTADELDAIKNGTIQNANFLIAPLVNSILGISESGDYQANGLINKILTDPALVNNIKGAIDDMVGTGWFSGSMKDKKDEWIKVNSAIDPAILNALYNNISIAKREGIDNIKDTFLQFSDTKFKNASQLTTDQIITLIQEGLIEEFYPINTL